MPRATNIAGMQECMAKLGTREGFEKGLAMVSSETDVFISPYAKCGTTWLQQIVHGLRTGGDMDFDDISRVVPWVEFSHDLGLDLEGPQKALPRAFKSHLPFDRIPKPGRYLVSLRDPKDAVVSAFRFMEGWLFEVGSIPIEEYARSRFIDDPGRGYFRHFRSWWEVRDRPNVLLLFFEDMKHDLSTAVRRIAELCQIELTPDLLDLVLEQASLGFMKRHAEKFDDLLMREHSEKVAQIPPGSDSAKVREGSVGSHRRELSTELSEAVDAIWKEELAELTGHESYAALRASRPFA